MGNKTTKISTELEIKAKYLFNLIDKDSSGFIDEEETMYFW